MVTLYRAAERAGGNFDQWSFWTPELASAHRVAHAFEHKQHTYPRHDLVIWRLEVDESDRVRDLGVLSYVRAWARREVLAQDGYRWVFFYDEEMPQAIYLGAEPLAPTLADEQKD
jgi:hypothetical protein